MTTVCVYVWMYTACKLREHELPPSLQHHQRGLSDSGPGNGHHANQVHKKPRLVFTDIQRRTLLAIFKETRRPNKDMQATIAEQLGLKVSTVANFFMNARRRSLDKYLDDPVVPSGAVRAVQQAALTAAPPQQVPAGTAPLGALDVDNGL